MSTKNADLKLSIFFPLLGPVGCQNGKRCDAPLFMPLTPALPCLSFASGRRAGHCQNPISENNLHDPCSFYALVAPLWIIIQVLRRDGGNVKGPRAVYVCQEGISPFSNLFIVVARSEPSTLWFADRPDGILECLLRFLLLQNGLEIQG
jgi:hypothetical protein